METTEKKKQGFATMPPEKRKEIASKGGKAAHAAHTAHRFTSEEASAAGKKGGATTGARNEHMKAIGRKGGLRRQQLRKENGR